MQPRKHYTAVDPTAPLSHAGSPPFMSTSRMCCLPADIGAAAEGLPSTADRPATDSKYTGEQLSSGMYWKETSFLGLFHLVFKCLSLN